jgi:hypothetical protein
MNISHILVEFIVGWLLKGMEGPSKYQFNIICRSITNHLCSWFITLNEVIGITFSLGFCVIILGELLTITMLVASYLEYVVHTLFNCLVCKFFVGFPFVVCSLCYLQYKIAHINTN